MSEVSSIQRCSWDQGQICIIGQGGAGKTSLVRILLGESIEGVQSTVGIEQNFVCDRSSITGHRTSDKYCWKKEDADKKRLEPLLARAVHAKRNTSSVEVVEVSPSVSVVSPSKQSGGGSSSSPTGRSAPVQSKDDDDDDVAALMYAAEAVTIFDEQEVIHQIGEANFDELKMLILDLGGQSVFNIMHHLFITPNSVYLIVFNMEWLKPSASELVRNKALSYLRFWINSVIVHTFNSTTRTTATILFVGTHKDKVPSIADHEAISNTLFELVTACPVSPDVIPNKRGENSRGAATLQFFAVDNLVQGLQDATTKHMMEELVKFLSTAPYVKQLKPMTWVKFSDMIRDRRNQLYMSFADTVALAGTVGIPQRDVEALLKFLHEMSVLMWFPDEGLRDVVILDPVGFFVPAITSIIRKHDPTSGDDSTHHDSELHVRCRRFFLIEWRAFLRTGVLDAKLLSMLLEFWAEHESTITLLMIKFGMLVPFATDDSDTNTSFIVPSLLPASSVFVPNSKNYRVCNSCVLVFTLDDSFSKKSFVSKEDLAFEAFLPDGMFSRLLGKLIGWSQETSASCSVEAMDLFLGAASLWFGNQSFRIVEFSELKYILMEIEGLNPCAVQQQVMELAEVTVNECMRNLKCHCLLPFEDGFIPLPSLFASVSKNQSLRLSGGRVLEVAEMKSRFAHFLAAGIARDDFDVFFSYRWNNFDSAFTSKAFSNMTRFSIGDSKHPVYVFLDRERLKAGDNFQEAFATALIHSSVVVPIVSAASFEKLMIHNPSDVDKMLVEWILALEAYESKATRVEKVFPILIGCEDPISKKVGD